MRHQPKEQLAVDYYKAFFLDLDGVLWLEGVPIRGASEVIEELRRRRKKLVFLTNKSTGSRKEIRKRVTEAGIDIQRGEVISSAYAVSVYLRRRFGPSRIYAIGSEGVSEELNKQGHTISDCNPHFVVLGYKPPSELTEQMVSTACKLIRGGAKLIACNKDRGNPLPDGTVSPGSYYTVGTVERAAGVQAGVVGKPFKPIFDIAFGKCGESPQRCLMVGDGLVSDIKGGKEAGLKTVLVLSGFTSKEEAESSEITPDYTLSSISELCTLCL